MSTESDRPAAEPATDAALPDSEGTAGSAQIVAKMTDAIKIHLADKSDKESELSQLLEERKRSERELEQIVVGLRGDWWKIRAYLKDLGLPDDPAQDDPADIKSKGRVGGNMKEIALQVIANIEELRGKIEELRRNLADKIIEEEGREKPAAEEAVRAKKTQFEEIKKAAEAVVQAKQAQLAEIGRKIADVEGREADIKEQQGIPQTVSKITLLKNKITELEAGIEGKKAEIERKQAEIDGKYDELISLSPEAPDESEDKKLSDLEEKINKISQVQDGIYELEGQLQKLKRELQELEQKLETAKQDLSAGKQALGSAVTRQKGKVKPEKASEMSKDFTIKQACDAIAEQKEQLAERQRCVQEELTQIKQELAEKEKLAQEQIAQAEQELRKIDDSISLNRRKKDWAESMLQLMDKCSEKQAQIQACDAKEAALKEKLKGADRQILLQAGQAARDIFALLGDTPAESSAAESGLDWMNELELESYRGFVGEAGKLRRDVYLVLGLETNELAGAKRYVVWQKRIAAIEALKRDREAAGGKTDEDLRQILNDLTGEAQKLAVELGLAQEEPTAEPAQAAADVDKGGEKKSFLSRWFRGRRQNG